MNRKNFEKNLYPFHIVQGWWFCFRFRFQLGIPVRFSRSFLSFSRESDFYDIMQPAHFTNEHWIIVTKWNLIFIWCHRHWCVNAKSTGLKWDQKAHLWILIPWFTSSVLPAFLRCPFHMCKDILQHRQYESKRIFYMRE